MQPGCGAMASVLTEDLNLLDRGTRFLKELAGNFGAHPAVALAGNHEQRNRLYAGDGRVRIHLVNVEACEPLKPEQKERWQGEAGQLEEKPRVVGNRFTNAGKRA